MQVPREIKVKTIHEAEKQVYQLIKQSVPQNEITQIDFVIDGILRHFSPSQISKIKKKMENTEEDNNKDSLTQKLFVDFENGETVMGVVTKKGYKLEIIEAAYENYLRLNELETVPKWFIEYLRESCYKLECHYGPENPIPKEKIDFMDIGNYLNDCANLTILSETQDFRIH